MGIFDFLKKGSSRRDTTTTRNTTIGTGGTVGGGGSQPLGSQPLGTQRPNFGNVQTGTPQSKPNFSNVNSDVRSTAPDARPMAGGSQGVAHQSPGSAGGSQTYTVKPGDTLSKIAKEFYGNANEYMKIFEANQPLLKDPDKIYPGQELKIPSR